MSGSDVGTSPGVGAEIGGSMNAEFEKELTHLINRHSIENEVDMPDFLLARMLCAMIESMGPTVKATLDWHGCASVCHPRPNNGSSGGEAVR